MTLQQDDFEVKDWHNQSEAKDTPLNAPGIEDLEARLALYAKEQALKAYQAAVADQNGTAALQSLATLLDNGELLGKVAGNLAGVTPVVPDPTPGPQGPPGASDVGFRFPGKLALNAVTETRPIMRACRPDRISIRSLSASSGGNQVFRVRKNGLTYGEWTLPAGQTRVDFDLPGDQAPLAKGDDLDVVCIGAGGTSAVAPTRVNSLSGSTKIQAVIPVARPSNAQAGDIHRLALYVSTAGSLNASGPPAPWSLTAGTDTGEKGPAGGVIDPNGTPLFRMRYLWLRDPGGTEVLSTVAGAQLTVSGAKFTKTAHGLPNGTRVKVAATGGGFSAGTIYFVVGTAANTFQLSATFDGAAITPTVDVNSVNVNVLDWLFPLSGSINSNYQINTYRGCKDTGDPFDDFKTGVSSSDGASTFTWPAVTPTQGFGIAGAVTGFDASLGNTTVGGVAVPNTTQIEDDPDAQTDTGSWVSDLGSSTGRLAAGHRRLGAGTAQVAAKTNGITNNPARRSVNASYILKSLSSATTGGEGGDTNITISVKAPA